MCVVDDPVPDQVSIASARDPAVRTSGQNLLLDVPGQERNVQEQRNPVSVDEEQEGEEAVYGRLGNDVRVEAVAKIDGVDVVAARGITS